MQKRERLLAGAVAVMLGGWLIDSVVVQPTLAWFTAIEKQTTTARQEVGEANALIERQARIVADWRARHAAGLCDDEDQARFRLQRTLQGAAHGSGFTIAAVSAGQLIPANQDQVYDLLRLTVSGHGGLTQVQGFVAALEVAGMPLCIERSEWSAGDARKDHLDVALTVSTRLVSAKARAGRAVPEGTVAWVPAARSTTLDAAVAAAKPFLSDRRGPHQSEPASAPKSGAVVEAAVPTSPSKGWALVGIVAHADHAVAFVRHQGDGSERQLRINDTIESFTVTAVDAAGLHLHADAGDVMVAIGQDLAGNAISGGFTSAVTSGVAATTNGSSRGSTPTGTLPAGTAASPFQVPAATSDPARDAVLQRLRERRNRTP